MNVLKCRDKIRLLVGTSEGSNYLFNLNPAWSLKRRDEVKKPQRYTDFCIVGTKGS